MYRHLVAVEVGVKRRTHQWVQLDRLAFDQCRLKRLDTQTMQGRCTVQHHRVLANDVFEDVPYHWLFGFHHTFGGLDGGRQPHHFQLVENERFE